MILHTGNPNVIFVHIPKTAGTSIEHAFKPHLKSAIYGDQAASKDWKYHTTALQFKQRLNDFDDFYKFSIVRNPYDRLYSWGCVMCGGHKQDREVTQREFKSWLLFGKVLKGVAQRKQQVDWLTDRDGNLLVDYVGKFEKLKSEVNKISRKLFKDTVKLPHLRKSNRVKDYKSMYDDEMIEYVETYHKDDLKLFEYSFEESK